MSNISFLNFAFVKPTQFSYSPCPMRPMRGILKTGSKSTSDLRQTGDYLQQDEGGQTLPVTRANAEDKKHTPTRRRLREVKFSYVSPMDKWGVRKLYCRSLSMESVADIERNKSQSSSGHRKVDQKNSNEKRLKTRASAMELSLVSDIEDIQTFLDTRVRNRFRQPASFSLPNLSISEYFEVVKSITNTFDGKAFKSLPMTHNTRIKAYVKLTMKLATNLNLDNLISEKILEQPIMPHASCSIRKKKMLFLKALIDHVYSNESLLLF